ncbi:hypothetical protein [Alkalicoccus daliensis]|uniref:Uncharacterized protein n=1 Tax=Alkalicoccus daliensis TaxID=745820 RepID=A0A1H0F6Q7_9BACI|nr:hypothetical protein [Alkalicoccus daliensis]SDN90285.1 hypothetical protein SAMN04488053_104211 [Alkalicoccus daliensis]
MIFLWFSLTVFLIIWTAFVLNFFIGGIVFIVSMAALLAWKDDFAGLFFKVKFVKYMAVVSFLLSGLFTAVYMYLFSYRTSIPPIEENMETINAVFRYEGPLPTYVVIFFVYFVLSLWRYFQLK